MANEQKTIIQRIFARLNELTGKKEALDTISIELQNATPKDLSPEDVIELFNLKPNEIPALIEERPKGIPDHIPVLNEVHLENATPEEFLKNKGKPD